MKSSTAVALSVGFMLALAALPVAAAQSFEGLFAEYEFAVGTNQGEHVGLWRQEVLRDLGDGRVELRTEIQVGETQVALQRNVSATHVRFPIVPTLAGFEFEFTRDAADVSVALIEVGAATIMFQTVEYTVNTTDYNIRVLRTGDETSIEVVFSGTAQAFRSGLLYTIVGEYRATGERTYTGQYHLVLQATNLPLDAAPASSSGVALFPALQDSNSAQAPQAAVPRAVTPELLLALGSAVAVIGTLVYLSVGRRRKRPAEPAPKDERPPHWVA